ncbi:MAG: indole-3-glycerol phosphate synthase [Candidatus Binatota bacterium]|jgi:indole-3-glycerol phosphate synthase|nr:indole-3-glycerol phosphate synthase [Candidatus Binatota bacterium]
MILDEIVESKKIEIAEHKAKRPLDALRECPLYAEPRRGFREALERPGRAIVAEVKKASPSRGVIRSDFDPVAIARGYEEAGARAISVLTDSPFFQGSLIALEAIHKAVALPCLRKDFVLDPYQIHEARAFGADAVLLIVAILDIGLLRALHALALEIDLDPLVEVHSEEELERAVGSGARLVGINNRDLRTFVTDVAVSERLAARAPEGVTLVAESGLKTRGDLERLERGGVRAFLIGETLMAAPDPGAALQELLA